MGDMTIESFWSCESEATFATQVLSKDRKTMYDVTYGRTLGRVKTYEYGWSCTCKAMQFGKGKPCKHVELVKASKLRCGWNQQMDGGEIVPSPTGPKCPKCGRDCFAFRAAV